MVSKIDVLLETVGALGVYQWRQLFLIALGPIAAPLHFISIVFHSIKPTHRCKLPEWENDTFSPFSEVHNQSIYQWIPVDKDGILDSCKIYTNNNETVECEEHVFDKSVYWGVTLNEQFNMVCGESVAGTTVKVVFSCGLVAGAIVVGALSDRFGRKVAYVGCLVVGGATGIVAAFSVNYYMFAALRFFIAMCMVGIALIVHIINIEIVGPSGRSYAVAFRNLCWPIGVILTSLFAYFLQDWNNFQLAISVLPIAFSLPAIILLKETPHYLVTKGKHEEAESLFEYIAKTNGKTLPENFMDDLKEDEEAAVTEKVKDIFKAPVLIKRLFIFVYLWFIAGLGYYGLGFNVSNLTGDIFVNNVISGVADLPKTIFVLFAWKFGRKAPTIFCLLFGSAALLISAFMTAFLDTSGYSMVIVIISMVGKLGIATVLAFDYFWSSEMFPSTLRSTLVGFCSLCARVGIILAPIIVDLNLYVKTVFGAYLGALIFGITMFIGGILAFLLPETNKQRMPETIAEANVFLTKRQVTNEADESNVEKFDMHNLSSTTDLIDGKKST